MTEQKNDKYGRPEEPYEALLPIMRKFGAKCKPKEFYWAVNDAYHAAEAEQYESLHLDMFQSLGPVWERMLTLLPCSPPLLQILDIGSGTGLVGDFIQRIAAGRVGGLTLLDPSPKMQELARAKSAGWSFPSRFITGDVEKLDTAERYDVITVNSVLHHVVDLHGFFSKVEKLLVSGGSLMTAHDPRHEAVNDTVFLRRYKEARRVRRLGLPRRSLNKLRRLIVHLFQRPSLPQLALSTSEPLLRDKIIAKPMGLPYIWAVTDFHVPGLPGNIGSGINMSDLRSWLQGLELVDSFTYKYHAIDWDELTDDEKTKESGWWRLNDQHGQLFGSVWKTKKI